MSKDIVINLFDFCGITTDNAEKISSQRNTLADTSAGEIDAISIT